MTAAQHREAPAKRGRGTWTREVIELALLCVTAGVAHLVIAGLRTFDTGSYLLITLGALLMVVAAARHMWVHRPRTVADEREPEPEVADRPRTLWRLRASVADTPGRLAGLASGLAALGGNIRTVHVHPVEDGAVDEVLVHVPATVGEDELVQAVVDAGGRDVTAARADVRELDDVPTRTLNLAASLVDGRGDLVRALLGTLGPAEVRWQEEPRADTGPDGAAGRVLCLSAPGGGVLVLERAGASFTPAEFARARAMVELAATCRGRLRPEADTISAAGGEELTVRVADREDLNLVSEFHTRCSAAARYRRYFSPGPAGGESGVLRLLTPALGRSLLVQGPDGDVVAMGNLMREGQTAEVALLVRDDWQRRGIGAQLAGKLIEQAAAAGLDSVQAHTHVDNTAIARTLRAAGLKLVGVPEPGEWSWSRSLTATPAR